MAFGREIIAKHIIEITVKDVMAIVITVKSTSGDPHSYVSYTDMYNQYNGTLPDGVIKELSLEAEAYCDDHGYILWSY